MITPGQNNVTPTLKYDPNDAEEEKVGKSPLKKGGLSTKQQQRR
jgi:hypothetical protein